MEKYTEKELEVMKEIQTLITSQDNVLSEDFLFDLNEITKDL